MDYEFLRGLADSYGLLALTVVFVGIVIFVFRRGSGERYRDASQVPFRHDRAAPRGTDEAEKTKGAPDE